MKVKIENKWTGVRQSMELSEALTPTTDALGKVEQAQADAALALDTIGRCLAEFVEQNLISLEMACRIAGVRDVQLLSDDDVPV